MTITNNIQQLTTVGATPGFLDLGPIELGQAFIMKGEIIAMSSTGLVRSWSVQRTIKRTLAGVIALVGTLPPPVGEQDAGTGWSIALVMGGPNGNMIRVQCTGSAGLTVRWNCTPVFTEVSQPE